jgi:hypothetical protein
VDFDSLQPYTPFLVTLSRNNILNPSKSASQEMDDLQHIPYKRAIAGVLTGFSRLIGTSIHPSQFQHVIIFVTGGITFQEIAKLQELYREHGVCLIVGSNSITNRDSLMAHIFKSK